MKLGNLELLAYEAVNNLPWVNELVLYDFQNRTEDTVVQNFLILIPENHLQRPQNRASSGVVNLINIGLSSFFKNAFWKLVIHSYKTWNKKLQVLSLFKSITNSKYNIKPIPNKIEFKINSKIKYNQLNPQTTIKTINANRFVFLNNYSSLYYIHVNKNKQKEKNHKRDFQTLTFNSLGTEMN